jgi:hypothetical protein
MLTQAARSSLGYPHKSPKSLKKHPAVSAIIRNDPPGFYLEPCRLEETAAVSFDSGFAAIPFPLFMRLYSFYRI